MSLPTEQFRLVPIGRLGLVKPSPNTTTEYDLWSTETGPAQFDMFPMYGTFPAGWVLLDGRLIRHGADYRAKLLIDLGNGFENRNSIAPPISRKGTIHELIWLPPNIKRLRWQATNAAGVFEQSPLRITKICWIERVARMIRRIMPMLYTHPRERRHRAGLTLFRMLYDLRGAYEAAGKFRAYSPTLDYPDWIVLFATLTQRDRRLIKRRTAHLRNPPVISLLLPVRGERLVFLRQAVASVVRQLYPHWELCIALDRACSAETRRVAEDVAAGDRRIRVVAVDDGVDPTVLDSGLHRNDGQKEKVLGQTRGEYIALLGPDDLLPEHALYCLAAEISAHPDVGMLYTDEDRIDDAGVRSHSRFKPDWNPQLLLTGNYIGGLCAWRRTVLLASGNEPSSLMETDGYGLALSAAQRLTPEQIRHIPFILYHRRGPERPAGGKQVLEEHLAQTGVRAQVLPISAGAGYRIRYALPEPPPLVSIIIPTRDGVELLRRCIESLRSLSSYPQYEIIVVDNQSSDPAALAYLDELSRTTGVSVLRYDRPFNFSAINNFAARQAKGDVLCLLNNDTEVISPDWLEEMVGHLGQNQVGVVGAKLYYPDGRVQHAGDVVGVGGCANHLHSMLGKDDPGYCNRAILAQDLSAVTAACLVTWRDLYLKLGGLNEKDLPVAFNDVDYCLRVREAGKRVVWTPHAELYHHESASRGRDRSPQQRGRATREAKYMRRRWKQVMNHDPAYNPNLSQERADFSLSHAPMTTLPWRE
jgi:O-antigen biosynthesis protein